MPTVFPEVRDATLQKLCDAILTSIRGQNSRVAAAGFTDRTGQTVVADSSYSGGVSNPAGVAGPAREVVIQIRINPDGTTAVASIRPNSPAGLEHVHGILDPALLATKLV